MEKQIQEFKEAFGIIDVDKDVAGTLPVGLNLALVVRDPVDRIEIDGEGVHDA